jgi:hypothetical protein
VWVGPQATTPPSIHVRKYFREFGSILPKGRDFLRTSALGGLRVVWLDIVEAMTERWRLSGVDGVC